MKLILAVIFSFSTFFSFAQIKFEDSNTNWEKLSEKARKEKKLIFVHFENSSCQQCNEVASQGFSKSLLTEKFAHNFVSIRLNVESENGLDIKNRLNIQGSLLSVFADPDGNILEIQNGSTNNAMLYAEKADIALGRKSEKGINEYAKEYQSGNRSSEFLRKYLLKLGELQMNADEVLDSYTAQLPADSMQNFNTVRFIYKQGPALNSTTFEKIGSMTPHRLIDSVYRSVPYQEAVAFNNGIINHSMRNAITRQDFALANRAAYFAQSTYDRDPKMGRIAFEKNMLHYYYSVKDTARYLSQTAKLIEKHYLTISLDSLKALDQAEMDKMASARPKLKNGITEMSFRLSKPSQFFPMELNNRAWHFYELTTDNEYLEKALSWSKTAMEWNKELQKNINNSKVDGNPSYTDTYAHLLYKLGRKDEAIEWQTKAVEQQRQTGIPFGSMETALAKMKAGTL